MLEHINRAMLISFLLFSSRFYCELCCYCLLAIIFFVGNSRKFEAYLGPFHSSAAPTLLPVSNFLKKFDQ